MNPKSFKVKRLSVPSGNGRNVVLQLTFSTHFSHENKIRGVAGYQSSYPISIQETIVTLTIAVKFI